MATDNDTKTVTPGNIFRAAARHIDAASKVATTKADYDALAAAWDVTAVILRRVHELTEDPFAEEFARRAAATAVSYRDIDPSDIVKG